MQKMPLLRELKLNNSALSSVRDLGSKLRHLQVIADVQLPDSLLQGLLLYQIRVMLHHRNASCRKRFIGGLGYVDMTFAGLVGLPLWLDRIGWVERPAQPQGAVCGI